MISGDARFYTATIANERGRSEYDIHVRVIRISCYTNLPAYFSMFLLIENNFLKIFENSSEFPIVNK